MEKFKKLAEVQAHLKAPKGQYNSFGGYYYRSLEDIQEAVKPLLKEQGLALLIQDSMELVGDRYYIKATAMVVDTETGDSVETSAFAREPLIKKGMDEAQISGSTSSYARKYALNSLFCIDDAKDTGTEAHADQQKQIPHEVIQASKEIKELITKGIIGDTEAGTLRQLKEAGNYGEFLNQFNQLRTSLEG